MNAPIRYTPSALLDGESGFLRENSFTRWMSRDLMQAATDFCKNIGLFPLYAETSKEDLVRYLFWRLPAGARIEIRTGRTRDKFEEFDRSNHEKNCELLSLHVSENESYSAVWISSEHYEHAKQVLAKFGISPAVREIVC